VDKSHLEAWLHSAGPWAPIAFVSISIVLMSTVIPKTAVSVTAGALFGTMLGSSLMVVIAVASAALNYSVGYWWLRDSIRRRLGLTSRERCSGMQTAPSGVQTGLSGGQTGSADEHTWTHAVVDLAAEAGFGLHLLIRLSPVPTMVISYGMGAVGARWLPYLAAAAAAIIPQILWVHSGATASMIHNPDATTLRWLSGGLSLVVAIAVSIMIPRQAMRRLQSQTPLPCSCEDIE
jgi:uncharacterized membrane protein YdjX (TVP38/TMEM64 family)